MAVAVKKHAKVDIKLFLSCPVLLDFPTPFQISRPGLQDATEGPSEDMPDGEPRDLCKDAQEVHLRPKLRVHERLSYFREHLKM